MSVIIAGTSDDSVGQYINSYLAMGGTKVVPPYSALGWMDGGKLISQAVFNNYTGSNIDIHINGRLTRKRITEAYRYVFIQLKCNRLSAMIPVNNENLSNLTDRLGFVYECTLRDYQGTPDEPIDVKVYRLSKTVAMKWIDTHG